MQKASKEKQNSGDEKSPIKAVSSRIAWTSPWYQVREDKVLLPDGSPGVFNVVEHSGAVWIIPVTSEGDVVLLRHYRYSVDDWCWEIPAGGIKVGLSLEETALAELREEVGGTASEVIYIGQFYTSNGISNEVAHIFLALGVELGESNHEPAEVIEVHLKPLDEIMEMAHRNEISDGPSALALFLCEERLRNLTQLT
jgi:8-oxo-dGTP pyrophosphatase MutT (NUDIX family)